jgi:hypothetical protein
MLRESTGGGPKVTISSDILAEFRNESIVRMHVS